ncbi:heterokaryon incompatibility protein-domain-containing protein [Xylaria sp. FL0933]|nr:heterokaryon incompatibility protein-domain-containing protein [Xylaria sp. FL0933]
MDSLESIFAHDLENISHSESFTYGSSRLGLNEVRILVLLPQDYVEGSADVHCQLLRLDLNATEQHGLSKHPFIALSYVWGDPGRQKEIFINGKSKLVTSNLYDALIHIRDLLSPVTLWIDAICINQDDAEEREREIRKMTSIYHDATAVLLWLGPAEGDRSDMMGSIRMEFGGAADLLSKIAKSHGELSNVHEEETENVWTLMNAAYKGYSPFGLALWALFSLPVWKRVWIMQELILAQDTYLLWGRQLINFQVLDELLRAQVPVRPINPYLGGSNAALRRYTMAREVISSRGRKVSLLEALLATRYRDASLEHDYVYGLLGFVDLGDNAIHPAYNKPFHEVYLEAFNIVLRQETNVDILSACGRGWAACEQSESGIDLDWPTWLPDWSWKRIKQISEDEAGTAFHNDIQSLLLDTPRNTVNNFDACGGLGKCVSISPSGKQLSVRGIEFDIVEEILHYQDEMGFNKSELWVDAVKSMWDQGRMRNVYDNINILKHACIRTAAYGHKENRFNLGPEMTAFDDVETTERLAATMAEDDIYPVAFEPFDSNEDPNKTTGEEDNLFDSTLVGVGMSKSWYCVTKRGYVGRSPVSPGVGDNVCVLFGGKVPMLLRKQEESNHFRLVGEIYIHGIMKGAAMEAMKDQWKDFVIV